MPNAFIHKPRKGTLNFNIRPGNVRWDTMWDVVRAAKWYEPGIGYVGDDGKFAYFQLPGLTTGFARINLPK